MPSSGPGLASNWCLPFLIRLGFQELQTGTLSWGQPIHSSLLREKPPHLGSSRWFYRPPYWTPADNGRTPIVEGCRLPGATSVIPTGSKNYDAARTTSVIRRGGGGKEGEGELRKFRRLEEERREGTGVDTRSRGVSTKRMPV